MVSLAGRAIQKFISDGATATLKTAINIAISRLKPAIAYVLIQDTVSIDGIQLDVSSVPLDSNMRSSLYYGTYEIGERQAVEKYLFSDMDVVELGACIGFIACLTNKQLGDSSNHVVVEPNPHVISSIKTAREMNKCDFEILKAGYAPISDSVNISATGSAWSASGYRSGGEEISVEAINLQTLIHRFGLSDFALIVDIEGAEADLINNELSVLESNCNLLIVEFHDDSDTIDSEHCEAISEARETLLESEFEMVSEHKGVTVFLRNSILNKYDDYDFNS